MPFTRYGWTRPAGPDGTFDTPPDELQVRELPTSDLIKLLTNGAGLTMYDGRHHGDIERAIAAELDRRIPPAGIVESIATMVQGDGQDAQRLALADAIREGRSYDRQDGAPPRRELATDRMNPPWDAGEPAALTAREIAAALAPDGTRR